MLELVITSKFRKDLKRLKKHHYDLDLLFAVIDELLAERKLADKHHDHALSGNYAGFRECHILPDWLLIYEINHNELILTASRTGSDSDLF